MTRVEIKQLYKHYGKGGNVLSGLDLQINPGEFFFLLGPSGCGKSTLLRILAGLLDFDSGEILFDGRDVSRLLAEERRTPMVFQNYALWPHMTVYENVAFGLKNSKLPAGELKKRVFAALDTVFMRDYADRKVPQLSGGQQQRVALARALAVTPQVLLLDEPLSNLDARLRDLMRNEIRSICKKRELTAIYVTHDRAEALSMGDRIAVLDGGKVCQTGTPEDVYYRPQNEFVANFLGDMNFIDAVSMTDNYADTVFGAVKMRSGFPEKTKLRMFFRPEAAEAVETDSAGKPICDAGENIFSATVEERVFLGERYEYLLNSAAGKIKMKTTFPIPVTTSGEVFFRVRPENLGAFEK